MLLIYALLLIVISALALPEVRGWIGEKITTAGIWLSLDHKTYRRIDNLIVPSRGGTTQIDHVLVSVYGIFVIETKNMKGWIFGSADDDKWTQVVFKSKLQFQNPLRQNYRHTRSLAECLDLDHRVFHSVVWFIGDCTFKTEMPENVIDSGLTTHIKSFSERLLAEEQVAEIERTLRALKENPIATRGEHIRSLEEEHESGTQLHKVRTGRAEVPFAPQPRLRMGTKIHPAPRGGPSPERFGKRWEDLAGSWRAAIIRDTCPRCEASPVLEIQGADFRCKRCGAIFPRQTPPDQITLECPTCGIPVTPGHPICPKCGIRVRLSRPA